MSEPSLMDTIVAPPIRVDAEHLAVARSNGNFMLTRIKSHIGFVGDHRLACVSPPISDSKYVSERDLFDTGSETPSDMSIMQAFVAAMLAKRVDRQINNAKRSVSLLDMNGEIYGELAWNGEQQWTFLSRNGLSKMINSPYSLFALWQLRDELSSNAKN